MNSRYLAQNSNIGIGVHFHLRSARYSRGGKQASLRVISRSVSPSQSPNISRAEHASFSGSSALPRFPTFPLFSKNRGQASGRSTALFSFFDPSSAVTGPTFRRNGLVEDFLRSLEPHFCRHMHDVEISCESTFLLHYQPRRS